MEGGIGTRVSDASSGDSDAKPMEYNAKPKDSPAMHVWIPMQVFRCLGKSGPQESCTRTRKQNITCRHKQMVFDTPKCVPKRSAGQKVELGLSKPDTWLQHPPPAPRRMTTQQDAH